MYTSRATPADTTLPTHPDASRYINGDGQPDRRTAAVVEINDCRLLYPYSGTKRGIFVTVVVHRPFADMGCFGSKDKLSKEDMDFLKSHTRYDEATIKEWYKGFKQDCPNGRLTPAKFVDMYKMFFPSGNAEEFCDHVFRTFDMDKNGYIDFKEFLLAIDVTSSGTPEEKLKWAFRMYDVDGNGVIDIQEMTKIVQAIYDMLGACSSNRPADSAEDRAKNIFAKMDENNDGQLTQDEFLKGCLQDEELSKMLAP